MNLTLEYESFQDFASKLWPHLSEEGMWVRSENPASVGELVDFDVMLADGFRLFHGTGQVIDVGPSPEAGAGEEGMTLRFSQLDQPSRNLVRKVVSKHIGEGGKLFVLSTPGTKVEVVGDEEAPRAEEGSPPAMGPEDLVAPFAGLEPDAGWSGEAEPELSSFLRPSGKAVDFVDETSADEGNLSRAPLDGPSATPIFETSAEAEVPGSGTEAQDLESAVDESSEAAVEAPGTEGRGGELEDSPDLSSQFDPTLAETQIVEPADFPEPGAVEMPLVERTEAFEPMPSTVIPPSLSGNAGDAEDVADGSFVDEAFAEGASRGRTWWPWVVVGGLAVGAGLYAVLQLDTPLSGLFGRGTEQTADSSLGAGTGSETAVFGADEATPRAAGEAFDGEPLAGAVASDQGLETTDGEVDIVAVAAEPDSVAPVDVPSAASSAVRPDDAGATPSPTVESTRRQPTATPAEDVSTTADAPVALVPLGLQRITWRDVEGDTVVRLALSGPVASDRFETQRVSGGSPRHVFKLLGAEGGVPRGPVTIDSDHVEQLRFGVHTVDGVRQVHAVADLAEESVEFVGPVVIDDGAIELRFSRP